MEINSRGDDQNGNHEAFRFCPLIDNPEPDCYCANLTSQKIPLALLFCQENYRECDIYQRVMLHT